MKCNNFLFVRFSTRYFLKNKISRCFPKHALVYKMIHLFFLGGSGGSNAASIASSKTFFKPFCKIQKQNYTDGAIFLKKWNSALKYEKKMYLKLSLNMTRDKTVVSCLTSLRSSKT